MRTRHPLEILAWLVVFVALVVVLFKLVDHL